MILKEHLLPLTVLPYQFNRKDLSLLCEKFHIDVLVSLSFETLTFPKLYKVCFGGWTINVVEGLSNSYRLVKSCRISI